MGARDDLEAVRNGQLATRGPAMVNFAPAQAVGFDIVPSVVRNELFATRTIGTRAISASAHDLVVRRRPDGALYQSCEAWWGDDLGAVLDTVRRPMAHRDGRSYAPSGPWTVSGTLYQFGAVDGLERSAWQFDGSSVRERTHSSPTTTVEPLDLLPPEVTAPIRGGLSDVWREHSRDRATEYLTAIRILDHRVLLLEAHRTARRLTALVSAAWELTTFDAPIAARSPISFTCIDDGPTPMLDRRGI